MIQVGRLWCPTCFGHTPHEIEKAGADGSLLDGPVECTVCGTEHGIAYQECDPATGTPYPGGRRRVNTIPRAVREAAIRDAHRAYELSFASARLPDTLRRAPGGLNE